MGASERRELQNRLKILMARLLRWEYQPEYRSRSWSATLKERRLSLPDLLEENPSLKSLLQTRLKKAYPLSVLLAVKETNLDESTFPESCPYSLDEIFRLDFHPGESAG